MMNRDPTKNLMRKYIEECKGSDGNPPPMAFMGVGTWTMFMQDFLLPPEIGHAGRMPFTEVGGTKFFVEPYLQDGIVAFLTVPEPGSRPVCKVYEGLSFINI
jgi:hypothetical protein